VKISGSLSVRQKYCKDKWRTVAV